MSELEKSTEQQITDNETNTTTSLLSISSYITTFLLIAFCFTVGSRTGNATFLRVNILLIGLGILVGTTSTVLGIKWSWQLIQNSDESPHLTKTLPGLTLIIGGLFLLAATISSTLLFTLVGFLAR